MRIAILPNMTRTESERVTGEICRNLDALGIEYSLPACLESVFGGSNARFADSFDEIEKSDIVLAVGGDGSIIHAARAAVKYGKPILGVNAGRLAFMAGLESDELSLLSKLVQGDYTLDRRMLLKTRLMRGEEVISEDFALNGNVFTNYLCDGLILSTPTGSTAYSLSAGGPVVNPELESIIFTPVCPHSLTGRPVIFRSSDLISVMTKDGETLLYSNDGAETLPIDPDCRMDISASELTANFIRIKSDNFMDILYKKLAQRR